MRAYCILAENVHFNDFFVNKKFLLNVCSCAAKLNYNTDQKSYFSTEIVILKMYLLFSKKHFL